MVCVAPLVDDAEVRQFLQDAALGRRGARGTPFLRRDQRGRNPV